MKGVPGGPLFWSDFEKRVIDRITEEHKDNKRLRAKLDFWQSKWQRQNDELSFAIGDAYKMSRLTECGECYTFFVFDDLDVSCDCGIDICDECGRRLCYKCDEMFCIECSNVCEQCGKQYCIACIPDHNEELTIENEEEDFAFCSIECLKTFVHFVPPPPPHKKIK